MNKIWAALAGILGTCCFIVALLEAFTGGPTWDILSEFAASIVLFYYILTALRPKDKKFYALVTAIIGVCFIIIGLVGRVWGGQGTTIMTFYIQGTTLTAYYILAGTLVLVAAVLAYFNKGRRRRIRPMNIRLIKTTTNNQSSAN